MCERGVIWVHTVTVNVRKMFVHSHLFLTLKDTSANHFQSLTALDGMHHIKQLIQGHILFTGTIKHLILIIFFIPVHFLLILCVGTCWLHVPPVKQRSRLLFLETSCVRAASSLITGSWSVSAKTRRVSRCTAGPALCRLSGEQSETQRALNTGCHRLD